MEYLEGGRHQQIALYGDRVQRPSGPWTKTVHSLLRHLQHAGFTGAPIPEGFDMAGNELLSFIPGDVCNYPLSAAAASSEALISAARLLRKYHDATVTLVQKQPENAVWMLPRRTPEEVICHGDFAPYNVVLAGKQAIGIIDFDTVHPGPRVWDVSYGIYRWAPLKRPDSPDSFGCLANQISRAKRFCDHYGLEADRRMILVDTLCDRLDFLVRFMREQATQGNTTFQDNIAAGHDVGYVKDIAYIHTHRAKITQGLLG